MVIDSSAIIAFLRSEAEADAIEDLLDSAARLWISAFTVLECRVVLHARFGPSASTDLELLLAKAGVIVAPFDAEQADLAFAAYRKYGKGTGHPAQLNLGDCASYALARARNLPRLFKGDDFSRTDIEPALGR